MKNRGRLRVLMIGPDRSVHGGISGVVNNYYEAGLDKKIDLCYIGTMKEGSKVRKLFRAAWAFAIFCLKAPFYRVVHVNMASDFSYRRKSLFVRTAKLFGKKIVIHQHGGDFEGFYYKEMDDKGRKKIDRVLSMGDAFLVLTPVWKEFFGHMVDNKGRIEVLPNAIPLPEAAAKEYGGHKILFLGRLCREKGVGELLEAMTGLKEKYTDVHLYLGGIWEDESLRTEAEKLASCVTWLGWVTGDEKEKFLKLCDIFVLPSYFEGQPVSVLEAMAYGCAVAASDVGGIPYMIQDGCTGVLVVPKDADSLQRGLERLLADAQLCRRLGEAAHRKAEAEFDIKKNMEQLISIYGKVSDVYE